MSSTADLSRVGAAIVTYASADHIDGCLDVLAPSRLGAVAVVDNASPDTTVEVLRRRGDPGLIVVEQDNIGFGGGCNTGARALPPDCDLVLFCNPDARIQPRDIALLATRLQSAPRVAMVGPRLRCGADALTSAGAAPRLATELRPLLPAPLGRLLPRRQLPSDHDRSQQVGYVEGACMLVRRSAFDEVGGFDERYFLGFEEIDLAARLHARGWGVELVAEAWAEHCAGQSKAVLPLAGREHALVGQLRYLRLHRGAATALLVSRAARLSLWLRFRTHRLGRADYLRLRGVYAGGRGGARDVG